eukprot:CAMPEP_0176367538 /NCGR_PEP_ID=MMETSP0126-20121128/21952_1 /TAXON_ID=141414 ORGANISM="Strombidinopsis acuminatum, Strain SPMC142" /NCGR_SAMPLE_ID=MMETSP0126 /ASSEMBLY_ACC=CAM_ASM_000229 /LENGTH=68 /DNA_ID=CAMNT_0017725403 /DNA_START=734 /DNA_END=940 /DNA_ORIENTATION=-
MDAEHYADEACVHFKKAIKCFKTINHLIGLHLCYQKLQELERNLIDIQKCKEESMRYLEEYKNYPDKD